LPRQGLAAFVFFVFRSASRAPRPHLGFWLITGLTEFGDNYTL